MEKINIENSSSDSVKERFPKGAGSNITELKIKIIGLLKKREIVLFLIFFFIASLSFGLGYLYAKDHNVAPIVIEKKC